MAYVGNVGAHLGSRLTNPNQIPIGYVAQYGASTLKSLLSSPAGIASGVAAPFPNFSTALGSAATVAQALKKYPQYTGITVVKQNDGHSTYNALQARLQRQFSNGFSMLASFTYAKQMSNAEDEIGQFNDGPQDTYSLGGEYVNALTQPPLTLSFPITMSCLLAINESF